MPKASFSNKIKSKKLKKAKVNIEQVKLKYYKNKEQTN